MSEQSTTETTSVYPAGITQDAIDNNDALAAAFGATKVREIDNNTVDIPAHRLAVFAQERTFFSDKPNTTKRELTMPSEDEANLLRAQLKQYAKDHDLGIYLPPADKFGRKLNSGLLVTYRFSERSESDASRNGEVTVTTAPETETETPAPPATPAPVPAPPSAPETGKPSPKK